jgi:hypothetical protein
LAFIAVFILMDEIRPASTANNSNSWKSKLTRVDFIGALTLLAAVASLILALDLGSNQLSWTSPFTLAILGGSLLLFLVFYLVEKYVAPEPFAPGNLVFNRNLYAAYLCNFWSFAGWLAALFYAPLHFQAVHGLTATRASLLLIPNIICGVSGSLFAGWFMKRTGTFYALTITCYSCLTMGMLIILCFAGAVVTVPEYQIPGMVVGMAICGFSNGVGVTSSLIGLLANATSDTQAVATACSYLFRSLGCVFGLAVSATAVNQTLRLLLTERLQDMEPEQAEKIAEMVRRSLETIKELPVDVREVVKSCYASSTRVAFGVQVLLVSGAAISAWFMHIKPLSR